MVSMTVAQATKCIVALACRAYPLGLVCWKLWASWWDQVSSTNGGWQALPQKWRSYKLAWKVNPVLQIAFYPSFDPAFLKTLQFHATHILSWSFI